MSWESTSTESTLSNLTASRDSQFAVEGDASGLFTNLLVDALDGGAADILGRVTAAGVYAYVEQSLGPWAQRPLFKSHVSSFSILRQWKPSVAPEEIRLLPGPFQHPHYRLPPDPSYEPTPDPSYEPTAEPRDEANEATFALLERFRAARPVEPIGEEHLYWDAVKRKPCRWTPLGSFYWQLAKAGRI